MKIYLEKSVYKRLQDYQKGISSSTRWWRECPYLEYPTHKFCVEATLTSEELDDSPLEDSEDNEKKEFHPNRLWNIEPFVKRMKILNITYQKIK